jgi:hypothetical protein
MQDFHNVFIWWCWTSCKDSFLTPVTEILVGPVSGICDDRLPFIAKAKFKWIQLILQACFSILFLCSLCCLVLKNCNNEDLPCLLQR